MREFAQQGCDSLFTAPTDTASLDNKWRGCRCRRRRGCHGGRCCRCLSFFLFANRVFEIIRYPRTLSIVDEISGREELFTFRNPVRNHSHSRYVGYDLNLWTIDRHTASPLQLRCWLRQKQNTSSAPFTTTSSSCCSCCCNRNRSFFYLAWVESIL